VKVEPLLLPPRVQDLLEVRVAVPRSLDQYSCIHELEGPTRNLPSHRFTVDRLQETRHRGKVGARIMGCVVKAPPVFAVGDVVSLADWNPVVKAVVGEGRAVRGVRYLYHEWASMVSSGFIVL
jgi:hypothetical protein